MTSAPPWSSTLPIQASSPSPLTRTTLGVRRGLDVLRPRLVVVRIGVGDAGSASTRAASPPTARAKSPSWVVVATTRTPSDGPVVWSPQPARSASSAGRRRERRGAPHADAPGQRHDREHAAAEHRDRRPGRRVELDRQPQPERPPPTAVSATVASCHVRRRSQTRRVVAAGTTSSAVASSAPTADSAATATSATSASSAVSGRLERSPSARAADGIEPGRGPARPDRVRRREHDDARARRPGDVAAVDREQAAEQQRLDVRAGVEDVGREDHARAPAPRRAPARSGCRSARARGARASRPPPPRAPPCRRRRGGPRSRARRRARARGTRPCPTACEKNASPRRTIHVPISPAASGEHRDLDDAALHERQGERVEHRPLDGTR